MSRRTPGWLANLLLLLGAFAVTLAGFEAALRLVSPQKLYRYPRDLFRTDPEIGFALNPGFDGVLKTPEFRTRLRINSRGLRNRELSAKPAGGVRVLVVGDSFVSALNVEQDQTFVAVAERSLAGGPGRSGVELVNAGAPNFGTWHELGILRRFVPSLAVDVAVLCVFVGNDLEDNLRPRAAVVRDGYLVERVAPAGLLPRPVRAWLQRHSMSYVFLWNAYDQVRARIAGRPRDPLGGFGALLAPTPSARIEEGYRESSRLLAEARDYLSGQGVSLLMVIIPQELQVYPEKVAALAAAGPGAPGTAPDLDRPDREWARIAQSLSLPVLDLLPVLRERRAGPPLYMPLDGHLTVEGNRVAGEAIAAALRPLLGMEHKSP